MTTFRPAIRENVGLCSVTGCEARSYCKGFCKKHYNRQWRHGDVKAGEFQYRFENHILKTASCWLWQGALFASGYGKASRGFKKLRAHRVAYALYVGAIPPGIHVLHKCDNPPCVNPAHLFLGTHLDNMRDMEAKGRAKWIQENLRRSA